MKNLIFLFALLPVLVIGQDGIHFSKKEQIITVDPNNNSFSRKVFVYGTCDAGTKNKASLYFGELEKVRNIKAGYCVNKNDKWKKINKKKLTTSSVLTSAFYAGIQKTSIPFPEMPLPYFFRYSYEMTNEDLLFLSSLNFTDTEHTDTFDYKIIIPDKHELHFQIEDSLKTSNLVQFEKTKSKDKWIYQFTAVPNQEVHYPKDELSWVRMIVTPNGIAPYDYFNDWYANLVSPNTALSAEVKAAVKKEVADISDERERIAAVFDLIKKRTSYIAIENGIGAVMPRNVNKIWTAQQGDCKDMSNLLCQSLRSLGYDAQLALSATIGHTFDLDFPALSSANHVICVLKHKDEWLYLDATERNGFFGYPSRQIQGRKIFIVDDTDGEIHEVPMVKAADNKVTHQLILEKKDNALIGTAKYDYQGMSQIEFRSANKHYGGNRLEPILEKYLARQSSNLNYENVKLSLEEEDCQIIADINSERNFTAIRKKNYLSLSFLPLPHTQEVDKQDTEVNFYETVDQQFTVTVKLDIPIRLQDFEAISIEEEGISFDFSVSQKGTDQIEIKYNYVNELLYLSNDKLTAFRKINNLIKETFRKTIIYENPT